MELCKNSESEADIDYMEIIDDSYSEVLIVHIVMKNH